MIKAAITRVFRPDLDTIVSGFVKASDKLMAYIDRETDALESDTSTIAYLTTQAAKRNANINRAYRVVHKLDTLVG